VGDHDIYGTIYRAVGDARVFPEDWTILTFFGSSPADFKDTKTTALSSNLFRSLSFAVVLNYCYSFSSLERVKVVAKRILPAQVVLGEGMLDVAVKNSCCHCRLRRK
jgi:hypothetical protein